MNAELYFHSLWKSLPNKISIGLCIASKRWFIILPYILHYLHIIALEVRCHMNVKRGGMSKHYVWIAVSKTKRVKFLYRIFLQKMNNEFITPIPKRRKTWVRPDKPGPSVTKYNIHGGKCVLYMWWGKKVQSTINCIKLAR